MRVAGGREGLSFTCSKAILLLSEKWQNLNWELLFLPLVVEDDKEEVGEVHLSKKKKRRRRRKLKKGGEGEEDTQSPGSILWAVSAIGGVKGIMARNANVFLKEK